jgi:hypothetical protein
MAALDDLIGTWRVTAFSQWAPDGSEHHPIGKTPSGFAVFDATGRVFFQLSKSTADGASEADVASSFMAYFGKVTVSGNSLSTTVESGNNPEDIGTTQTRTITLDGDTLTIGIPGRIRATLRREAKS